LAEAGGVGAEEGAPDGASFADRSVAGVAVAGAAVEATGIAGGVATAGVAAAAAAGATGVSFLGTLVAWLAPGVSAGDVLGVPLAPRLAAAPVEFCTRALVDAARGVAGVRALAALSGVGVAVCATA